MSNEHTGTNSHRNYTLIEILRTRLDYIEKEMKIIIALNVTILGSILGYIFL